MLLDIDETLIHSVFPSASPDELGSPLGTAVMRPEDGVSQHAVEWSKLKPVGTAEAHTTQPSLESFELELDTGDTVVVNKRPGLDAFLDKLRFRERFRVIAFTAGVEVYSSELIDVLDPDGEIFDACFFRDSCIEEVDKAYSKDIRVVLEKLRLHDEGWRRMQKAKSGGMLSRIRHSLEEPVMALNTLSGQREPFAYDVDEYTDDAGELDVSRCVLVDNNPQSFKMQPENGILIPPFFDDPSDNHLIRVGSVLEELRAAKHSGQHADVRDVLRDRFFQLTPLSG